MVAFELTLAAIIVALLLVACWTDARARIIPDWVNIAIALLALPMWWVTQATLAGVAIQIGIAALVFLVFLMAFRIGQMGGGDVKMITALALALPPLDFLDAFVGMAMAGGILTSIQLVRHKLRADDRKFENPYGISIAIGAIVAIGGRYGYLPETAIIQLLTAGAIVCCLGVLIFSVSRRILSRAA